LGVDSVSIALLTQATSCPGSQGWLEYWDSQIYNYMQDPEHRRPKVLFSVQAVHAVLRWSDNPASLVGSISQDVAE
jgi:hypothetical protein